MSIVTGEMAAMLNVLGLRKGDNRILDVIVLVGPEMEVEDFDWGDVQSTYYLFRRAGTELLFEDEVLVSAMVRTQPDGEDETYGLYPRPGELLEGLSPTATRTEVAAALGKPERTGPNFDRYEINDHYLHFEFDAAGRVAKLSALLEPV
ncbi:hypothetical protein NONI108955_33715 [Nocardia ninae]|uniref:Uncharacterized protein n=1 Tax=Nocardia ninae NBRC 108245 TaxID=1210091 RepID=A0A511M5H9_9NOCA|nr:hypothetical protein [Nocardia ninae]GEM35914.1 hypothetical protein NN4_04330 [Nocardia ninae NBRC 108245]